MTRRVTELNFDDIKELYPSGSKIHVISHGEKVTGILKRLSPPSSVILIRSDTGRPKIIDCEKIESIDYADETTVEAAVVERQSSPIIVQPPSTVQNSNHILTTPLINLPSLVQPTLYHREHIKARLKEYRNSDHLYGVVAEWNQLDNAFEDAKKNNCLAEKKKQLFRQLKELMTAYPLTEIYMFAGDVYSACEQWSYAALAYGNAELYSEAVFCAEKVSDTKNFTVGALRKKLLVKAGRTLDDLRMFFYYVAEKHYHQIAAEVLEKISNELTDEERELVCQGGYKILADSGNAFRLDWHDFNYSSYGVQQIITVLKNVGHNDPPFELPEFEIQSTPSPIVSNMLKGKLTLFKTAELYGFIDGNIYFRLEQIEDKNLRAALNENGLWRNNIKVEYILGKSRTGIAADHVRLVEGESLPPETSKIHNGILESYDAGIDYGKVLDSQSGHEYGFRINVIRDLCLRRYLQDTYYISELHVQFTLKLYKSKEVVRCLRLTNEERINLNKEYGLAEPTSQPSLTDEKFGHLPEYQSLPPLPQDEIKVTPSAKPQQTELSKPYFKPISYSEHKGNVYNKGCRCLAEKKYAEAAACFEESISDENFLEKSLRALMTIYKVDYGENLEEQIEKGLRLLQQYESRLDKISVINERIQLLDKAKRQDELITELLKGIKFASKVNQRLHFRLQLAREYRLKGDYEAAKKCYEEWLQEKNSNGYRLSVQISTIELNVKQNLAICLYRIGNKTQAKKLAAELLEKVADNQTLRDILNDELQDENITSADLHNVDDVLFADNELSPLSPYVKDKLDKIHLEPTYSTTYHRLLKYKYAQNFAGDDFLGTPEEAAEIRKGIVTSLKSSSNKERSAAWAFVSKLTLKVYEKYSTEYDRCDRNRVGQFWENNYIAQFMGYAGDYELQQQLDCNADVARFFYNEEMTVVPPNSDIDARAYFIKFIVSFFRKPNDVPKLQPSKNSDDTNAHLYCLKDYDGASEPRKLLIATFFFPNSMQKRLSEFIEAMTAYAVWREEAAKLFAQLLPEQNVVLTENNFKTFWQKAKEAHLKNMHKFEQTLHDAAENYDSNGDNGLNSCLKKINAVLDSDVLSKTDADRVAFYCKLLSTMSKIADKSTFEEKEDDYRKIIDDTEAFEEKVFEKPTKLSYEVLRENLKHIKSKAEDELKKLYESSVPTLTIMTTIIGSEPVQFTVDIANKENCQTATNMKVEVEGMGNNIELKALGKKIGAVRGGSHGECLYEAILGDKEKSQGYLEVKVKVAYKYRVDRDDITEKIIERTDNLSLLNSEDYEEIENVYRSIAESNSVPTSSMFYGRDEDINKIVNMLKLQDGGLMKHRGIYMYGQKRAGKTSIMNHLKEKIRATHGHDSYIIVAVGSVGEYQSFFQFLAAIIEKLENAIYEDHKDLYQFLQKEGVEFPYLEIEHSLSDDAKHGIFKRTLKKVIEKSREFGGSEDKFIPLFLIDEFTYFYQWIKEDALPASFMQFWKAFLENNPICTIIIGMDHMPQFVAEYPNEFACMSEFPVSFLKENDTKDLANKPILLKDGSSRYKGKAGEEALSYIYRLTAGSAYLTVIFCDAFVDYLNKRKTTYITKTVADNFIKEKLFGKCPVLNEKFFDPQLNDPGKFSAEEHDATCSDNKAVLTYIAVHADSASRELSLEKMNCLNELSDNTEQRLIEILDRLTKRGVLTRHSNYYKIEIDLLRMWLLRECGKEF